MLYYPCWYLWRKYLLWLMKTANMKNILFIGAGASYGARIDQINQPPLGKDLLAFLRVQTREIGELKTGRNAEVLQSQPTLIESLHILEAHPSETNFEKLLPKLSRDERGAPPQWNRIPLPVRSLRYGPRNKKRHSNL